jgi:DNA repair protein RadC
MQVKSENPPVYKTGTDEDAIIASALQILAKRVRKETIFDSPQAVKNWLCLRSAKHEREVFTVIFLDSQHGFIEAEEMFTGTINQTAVYPREVVRRALQHNASAVILSHNHPSGNPQPSRADEVLTRTLKSALALVDVSVLDHFVTAGDQCKSMAEMGLV